MKNHIHFSFRSRIGQIIYENSYIIPIFNGFLIIICEKSYRLAAPRLHTTAHYGSELFTRCRMSGSRNLEPAPDTHRSLEPASGT